MGLFDHEFRLEEINRHNPPLKRLNEVIDWDMFRTPIETAFYKFKLPSRGGRPSYDRLMMFKILILQRYYNLSDDQTEFQIKDRLSFMDFLGLSIGDKVPDAKTIWLFKEKLKEKGLSSKLFKLFVSHLKDKGLIVKEGSLVDASFVDVPRQRNSSDENKKIKSGDVPEDWSDDKRRQKDIDARWTKKGDERHYGYKNHVNVDRNSKFIDRYSVSAANIHDSNKLRELIDETDDELHADSAYCSADIENYLQEQGCKSQVHEKGVRNRPLNGKQKESNRIKSKTRARVEHVFGFMTNSMNNGLYMRQIGKKRIASAIGLTNLTYNLFRFEQIMRLKNA